MSQTDLRRLLMEMDIPTSLVEKMTDEEVFACIRAYQKQIKAVYSVVCTFNNIDAAREFAKMHTTDGLVRVQYERKA
jgi:hypothetical protein